MEKKTPVVKVCLDINTDTMSLFGVKTVPVCKHKHKKKPNNWIITTQAINYIKQYVTGKNEIALMKGDVLDETKYIYKTYIRDNIDSSLPKTDDEYRKRRTYIYNIVLTYYNNKYNTSINLKEFLKFCNSQYTNKKKQIFY